MPKRYIKLTSEVPHKLPPTTFKTKIYLIIATLLLIAQTTYTILVQTIGTFHDVYIWSYLGASVIFYGLYQFWIFKQPWELFLKSRKKRASLQLNIRQQNYIFIYQNFQELAEIACISIIISFTALQLGIIMGINWTIQTSLLCITCPIILVVFMFYLAIYKSTFRDIYAEVDKIYKPIPEIKDYQEQQKLQDENLQQENKEIQENNQQQQQQLYIDPIQNELYKNFLDNGYEIGQKVDVA